MGRSDAVAVIATAEKEVENGDGYAGNAFGNFTSLLPTTRSRTSGDVMGRVNLESYKTFV